MLSDFPLHQYEELTNWKFGIAAAMVILFVLAVTVAWVAFVIYALWTRDLTLIGIVVATVLIVASVIYFDTIS